jgi:hypothetical protein
VEFVHMTEQPGVQEADRDCRSQVAEVVALVELGGVQPGPVVQQALREMAVRLHLHLDVELPPALVAGFHVQYGQLVRRRRLPECRVQDLDRHHSPVRWRVEYRVDKVDQQVAVPLGSEQPLEGVVDFRVDAGTHDGRLSNSHGSTPTSDGSP